MRAGSLMTCPKCNVQRENQKAVALWRGFRDPSCPPCVGHEDEGQHAQMHVRHRGHPEDNPPPQSALPGPE